MDLLDDLAYGVTTTPYGLRDILTGTGGVPARDVLRIQRIGGGDDPEQDEDHPRVTIHALAMVANNDPPASWVLAESVRERLNGINGHGAIAAGVLIDSCRTESGPAEALWTDPTIGCYVATYQLVTRSTA